MSASSFRPRRIANDPAARAELPSAPVDLGGLAFDFDGARYDLASFLAETETDGMLVLRAGEIVCERYGKGMDAATPHILMSVSKSVLGSSRVSSPGAACWP